MIDEGAGPGVEDAEQAEGGAEASGVLGEVLQGAGAGVEEEAVGQRGMGAHPGPELFRHGEGDQEVGDG